MIGADLSFLTEFEDKNGQYFENCEVNDGISILKNQGMDWVRLRIWHTPANEYLTTQKTLEAAEKIYGKNCKFLLDFHYSDTWADPGSQTLPLAWENLSVEVLADSVYNYTKNVIEKLKSQNTLPQMVQIGNEINGGFLWPLGSTSNWINFSTLLNAGISAIRDATEPSDSVKIMIHIASGGNNDHSVWFFDNIIAQNVEFDIIGQSYYPWWHGTVEDLNFNLNDLAERYQKDIVIVETAYPWTMENGDSNGNFVSNENQILPQYPATKEGQANFLFDLAELVANVSENRGKGIFYWEPALVPFPAMENCSNPWDNQTLFDFASNIHTFEEQNLNSTMVQFSVNMSFLPVEYFENGVAIRGDVEPLNWQENYWLYDNDNDKIFTANVLFPLSENTHLKYKFVIANENLWWESDDDRRLVINYPCNYQEMPLAFWDRNTEIETMGDINLDATIDILDIVNLVNFVLEIVEQSNYEAMAGDMNFDENLNVQDVILLVNLILGD